jgi:formate dehydrogenase maturation protein FdhE
MLLASKKSSTSRLTASRKKRFRRRATWPGVDWMDAAVNHCWRLDTLAELLQACGQPMEPAVLEGVGHLVSREVESLQTLLDELGKEAR